MRWSPGSGDDEDVEDRRGGGGGGLGGLSLLGRPIGIVGFLVLLAGSFLFKENLFALLGSGGAAPTQVAAPPQTESAGERREAQLAKFVFHDLRTTWTRVLPEQANTPFRAPVLVLFRDVTQAGCGTAQSSMGPFYCPADERVYLDLGFFEELRSRFGAPGEFAEAYVVAHEVGHHIQKLAGIEGKVQAARRERPDESNALSVRLELQADCFAGVWARTTQQRGLLEAGDVESALGAAAAVGDDRLQKQAGRGVHPESWTHGSAQQRSAWFKRGMEGGTLSGCDTFHAAP